MTQAARQGARTSAGLWDVPQGRRLYAAALEQATTTKFTPDEVHKLGLAQVAEISAQLDTILKSQGMTKGSVGDRLTALNAMPAQLYADTPAGRAELIAGLNAGNAAMQAKLAARVQQPAQRAADDQRGAGRDPGRRVERLLQPRRARWIAPGDLLDQPEDRSPTGRNTRCRR